MLRKTFFIIAMCLVGLSVWSMGVGNKVRVGVSKVMAVHKRVFGRRLHPYNWILI